MADVLKIATWIKVDDFICNYPKRELIILIFRFLIWQAIEAAIELNLDKVEAGAQGEHKIQRGYMPVATYSYHYIVDEGFRKSISDFLVRERAQVNASF